MFGLALFWIWTIHQICATKANFYFYSVLQIHVQERPPISIQNFNREIAWH